MYLLPTKSSEGSYPENVSIWGNQRPPMIIIGGSKHSTHTCSNMHVVHVDAYMSSESASGGGGGATPIHPPPKEIWGTVFTGAQ